MGHFYVKNVQKMLKNTKMCIIYTYVSKLLIFLGYFDDFQKTPYFHGYAGDPGEMKKNDRPVRQQLH